MLLHLIRKQQCEPLLPGEIFNVGDNKHVLSTAAVKKRLRKERLGIKNGKMKAVSVI